MERYRDASLPIEERLDDLLSRMTLEEKVLQTDQFGARICCEYDENFRCVSVNTDKLTAYFGDKTGGALGPGGLTSAQVNEIQRWAVEKTRLGIPFLFNSEGLHGVGTSRATAYPQQIGMAATFNPHNAFLMGKGIATEARAMGIHEVWAPVMDLYRDPRYGRGEETYGEDTFLGSEFAREGVRGMQGDSLTDPDAVISEPKHYVGYGNPVGGLNCAPSTMGRHDVFSDCMPIFEAAVKESGAVNIMCSYNSIDSIPVVADHEILTEVLRDQWGMRGFVRADMTAASRLYDWHFTVKTPEDAIKVAMEAGLDMQLNDFPSELWQQGILWLIREGKMDEKVLDEAARRVLRAKFLLGLFDHPYVDESRDAQYVHCQKHIDDSLQIARESMTLLKNDGILPLKKEAVKRIAVIGPAADSGYLGGYCPTQGRQGTVTILKGLQQYLGDSTEIEYVKGCNYFGEALHPVDPGMLLGEDGTPWLTARYYNGPVPEGTPVVEARERRICYNWILAKPYPEVDARCFSAVWTGFIAMPNDFDGLLGLDTQDSMRLYLDDELIVDTWGEKRGNAAWAQVHLKRRERHKIRVEFTNDGRGARVILGYSEGPANLEEAVAAAKRADVAVVCVGDNDTTCGENFDRMDLNLPGTQLDLVKAVYESGTPVVLVMQSGRPVSCTWEQDHIPAILEAWFPGERGGLAVAETLFGDNDPSGRLPVTFPRSVGQIPCHYSRRPGGGRRYIEMDWNPLYPFGYGLSYTSFEYEGLTQDKEVIAPGESVKVRFTVRNVGDRGGVAVPQLYLRDCVCSVVKPDKELAGFARVELAPGEAKEVEITVTPRSMRTLGEDYIWRVEPGEFLYVIADNAENALMTGGFDVVDPDAEAPAAPSVPAPSETLNPEGMTKIDNFFKRNK